MARIVRFFQNFADDDIGAVTIDWVVVTALVVALGIAVMVSVDTGVGAALNGTVRRMNASN